MQLEAAPLSASKDYEDCRFVRCIYQTSTHIPKWTVTHTDLDRKRERDRVSERGGRMKIEMKMVRQTWHISLSNSN